MLLLPPANEVCEGYVFTGVCLSTLGGGMHGFIWGGVWFYLGGMHGFIQGGMHGFIWGACMVLFGGHAWFYLAGMCGFSGGGGHVWFFQLFWIQ